MIPPPKKQHAAEEDKHRRGGKKRKERVYGPRTLDCVVGRTHPVFAARWTTTKWVPLLAFLSPGEYVTLVESRSWCLASMRAGDPVYCRFERPHCFWNEISSDTAAVLIIAKLHATRRGDVFSQISPCTETMTHFIDRNCVANFLPPFLFGASTKPKESSWKLSNIGFDTLHNLVGYCSSI
jgi:hypothetical protein